MTDDLSSYQSADTAWRYDLLVHDAEKDMARAEQLLDEAKARLDWLRAHPPLREYFNWSA